MSDELYNMVGRKQAALEQAYVANREMLNVLNALASGQITPDRLSVDLQKGSWQIKSEAGPKGEPGVKKTRKQKTKPAPEGAQPEAQP